MKAFIIYHRRRGFTLIEIMISMTILVILLLMLLSMTSAVQRTWSYTTTKIEQFRNAREGFETITRKLSQATLNTYWDYDVPNAPTKYQRQSELRFISGNAQTLTGSAIAPTHAIFFVAPLGYVSVASYQGLNNLLNTWGYFIEYDNDSQFLPDFIKKSPNKIVPDRYRFRLMEMMGPSETMPLYKYTSGASTYNGTEWFTDILKPPRPARVVAENVLALVILPKLSPADQAAGGYKDDALAPKAYLYDSTGKGMSTVSIAALNPTNQLPPVVMVTMVAVDEPSFSNYLLRLGGVSPKADLGLDTLFQTAGDLTDSSKPGYAQDLVVLQNKLVAKKINYRVFSTDVSIKAAKWSRARRIKGSASQLNILASRRIYFAYHAGVPNWVMNISVLELADLLAARLLSGGPETLITGFASLKEARSGDLSFFSDHRHLQSLQLTKASAVLVPENWSTPSENFACLAVADPSAAFDKVVDTFGFHATPSAPGIHPSAVVAENVHCDRARVSIGANAVIESGALIGNETEIGAGCFVGRNVKIGSGCKLFANSTVHESCVLGANVIIHSGAVIGADGFGYEFKDGRHRKVRQSGIVQIDDDVEIGAGSALDRARFGRTWIGAGTKIDNLVQIGHNVVIGKHCIIVAGTGIAGSAQIGDYVVIAAQSGIAGHVTVGSMCTLGGRSGVTKDIPPGRASYLGFPAVPAMEEQRRAAATRKLPQLFDRVKKLEQQMLDR